MTLDHGYYWISYRGKGPRISRWDGMFWWEDGYESPLRDDEVRVLSKRRIKPTAAVVRKAEKLST